MRVWLVLALPALALGQGLLGAPEQVSNLNDDQQAIVDFGFSALTAGDAQACQRRVAGVENFSQQVVAGTLYTFNLILNIDSAGNCPTNDGYCTMKVLDVPWDGGKQVLWDQVTCERDLQEIPFGGDFPIPGAPESIEDLNDEQQEIVDFAFSSLTSGDSFDCSRSILEVTDFTQQVVAGILYSFTLNLQTSGNCPVELSGGSCTMKVIDVPWEGGKEVLWDETSCSHNNDNRAISVPGAPVLVEELNDQQQGIVDFAFSSLTAGDSNSCSRQIVQVQDFTEQVVAGTLYTFNLVLSNTGNCPGEEEKSCYMEVLDVPWAGGKQVQWDSVTCNRADEEDYEDGPPLVGAPEKVTNLNDEQQGIVDYALSALSAGDAESCTRRAAKVTDFTEQLVAGTLYAFTLEMEASENCHDGSKKCRMKVLDVPWEGGKRVLWDELKCE